MNYIVMDMEWNQPWPGSPSSKKVLPVQIRGEIIQIGAVRINEENITPPAETEPDIPDPPIPPEVPSVTGPTEPSAPTDPITPSEPGTDPTLPTFPAIPDFQYPSIQIPEGFWGNVGGYGSFGDYGSVVPEEPEFELYDLEGDVLMTVTGQENMTLSITVDELDISGIFIGQTAQVRVEAIPDRVFPAQVTLIGRSAASSGGSSKFTVELTLEKDSSMLPGMSASASLPLSVVNDVPVIPLAALVEEGARTLVYTGYDEANGMLTVPVAVTVGASDSTFVQILTGLAPGDSFWYEYYDTLELSTDVDTKQFPFG